MNFAVVFRVPVRRCTPARPTCRCTPIFTAKRWPSTRRAFSATAPWTTAASRRARSASKRAPTSTASAPAVHSPSKIRPTWVRTTGKNRKIKKSKNQKIKKFFLIYSTKTQKDHSITFSIWARTARRHGRTLNFSPRAPSGDGRFWYASSSNAIHALFSY